jgi:hypothetical protein
MRANTALWLVPRVGEVHVGRSSSRQETRTKATRYGGESGEGGVVGLDEEKVFLSRGGEMGRCLEDASSRVLGYN